MKNENLRSCTQRLKCGLGTQNQMLHKNKRNIADGGTTMKFFSGNRPTASLLVILTAVLLLAQSALYGQATGNVTGIVADTTGAVIPKASVVLTNLGTGTKRTETSIGDGAFAFAGVTPDTTYRLDVSAPNFDSWQSQTFAGRAGYQLSYTDIHMMVGTAAAAVTG